ncbi:asmA family protein [Novosphingobium sp. JCM 18896]|uniref:AsmA family protein n=1 Tax=Novosphingobium sp. JCM 18896 TaxID=2989731 RepID=UPI00222389BE|nr:asmA family protein [Novosphingobium sp. JCM 18896]MCW1432181.1 asmA family protein [Novosphingobium sp. JCM 18896]
MTNIGRRAKVAIGICVVVFGTLFIGLAAFPAEWVKGIAERELSDRIGRPVTIGSVSRESAFSFAPVFQVSGLEVPQAKWAGPGKLASIDTLRIRIAILPVIVGKVNAELLSAQGVRLDFVRDANRRVNWRDGDSADRGQGEGISLSAIDRVDAHVHYRDALQKRSMSLAITIDPRRGLQATGHGEIEGNPVALSLKGPIRAKHEAWPFEVSIVGPAIDMRASGSTTGPFNTSDMTLRMSARANDLKLVDRVVEAGLFGTQPVNVTANVSHRNKRWTIRELAGTIGKSQLAGNLTVDKSSGRSKLDGDLRFVRLDFADLSTDAGQAKAAALVRAEGPKIVPATRINIGKIKNTDGRIAVRIDNIIGAGGSGLRSVEGVLTMDHQFLIAKPLTLHLNRGTLSGEIRVDQRKAQAEPKVWIALDLRDSSIDALAGGEGAVDAGVDGRLRLEGAGSTLREAVGRSDGTIGVVAHDGVLPTKLARLLGFDVGKGLFTGENQQARLRCAAIRLEMRRGVGTASLAIVDTSESQTRATGSVTFPEERIALTLTGGPKRNSVLRLPGSVSVLGSIREPSIILPRDVKSLGNVLKAVGRALAGKQGPVAGDADCRSLAAQVLR